MKQTPYLMIILTVLLMALPIAAQDGGTLTGSVLFGTASLRQGPDLGYPETGKAGQSSQLTMTGRTADGAWYLTSLETGEPAWVADYAVQLNGDSALLPVVEPAAPAPAPVLSDTLYVPPGCDLFHIGPFFGRAGQSVILTQGWEAATPELLNDYITGVVQIVAFDGRLLSTYSANVGEPFQDPATGTWRVFWSYNLGPVAVGQHQTEWTQMYNREITDGLDANNDGLADTYAPGNVVSTCTIIIE